jgi:hypothetical protein
MQIIPNHNPGLHVASPVEFEGEYVDVILSPILAWSVYQDGEESTDPLFRPTHLTPKPITCEGEEQIFGSVIYDTASGHWTVPMQTSGDGPVSLLFWFRENWTPMAERLSTRSNQ